MSLADVSVGVPALPVRRNYPGAFRRLYLSEMRLTLRRRRNLALLGVLAVVPIFIGVAVKISTPHNGDGPDFIGQVSNNGLFLVFTALTVALPLFLPLVVGVVSGDSIAGEAGGGTLRYLLTVPVTRGRLLAVKTLGVASYTAIGVFTVTGVGLVLGGILFGLHDVTLLSGDTVSLGNGLLRTFLVAAYVTVALFGLAAGGVFVSTLTENAIAAMATTIGLAVFSALLDAVPQLRHIHGILLTHNWLGFGELLRGHVDSAALLRWSGLHMIYAVVFLSLAWARLGTKDVTS
ncbi:MAG: type transport system permease protein [Actinomycetota bacterium]|jgi:ABC-2 type transport system permease protein|nr:type transport system permease protein [Actinomycetota bacterium]